MASSGHHSQTNTHDKNADKMKTYEKEKNHLKYDDVPKKKRGRKPNPIL